MLASIGVYILGVQGGLIAALLVFIGNRLCADNGYAGVVGSLTMTAIVFAFSFVGISPEMFISQFRESTIRPAQSCLEELPRHLADTPTMNRSRLDRFKKSK